MNKLLRKVRGVMGIGLTWGILWAAIFAALVAVAGSIDPNDIAPGEAPIDVWPIGGVVGLVSGVTFGTLLSFAESGKAILSISLIRAAMWGILGSAVFPLLTSRQSMVIVLCPIGAALAVASVAIARKATVGDSEQPKRVLDVIFGCVLTFVRDAGGPQKEPAT